jgi:hypothetical protein
MKWPGFFEGDFALCFIGSIFFSYPARHTSPEIKEHSWMK